MKNVILLSGIFFLFFCKPALTQTFSQPGFSTFNIASNWVQPVGAQFSANGQQLFVWEKAGKVFVCHRDANDGIYNKQAEAVIDISDEVGNWGDHGLLGFTLDPNFASNGFIYLLYVVDRHHLLNFDANYNPNANDYFKATIGRVTRYTIPAPNGSNLVANENTRTILLGESPSTGIPLLFDSHGVGTLAFAADGTLLVSAGDGATYNGVDAGADNPSDTYWQQALIDGIIRNNEHVGAFRAQMLNSHSGKLLRIDPVTGNGVSSNPFYSAAEPRSPKSRVWALGFRNPYRFSIRPGTGSANPLAGDIGEIYVGDVSWNEFEELNIIKGPGMNCGWPIFEGLDIIVGGYANFDPENRDELNPLNCQQYFTFDDLIKQATADGIKTVYNPCDALVPIGTDNRYVHRLPAIDWKHGENIARVGIFDGNNSVPAEIGSPESGVIGTSFQGNCVIGGCWYTGNLFPDNFRNTYFMGDLGGQWIKSLKIDFTDVVQEVQNLASALGQEPVVCIIENPLDGTLVYIDYNKQEIKTITYGGNQFPVVKMSSDQIYSASSSLNVNFTGTYSANDPDGNIVNYLWDFGDGNTSALANPSYLFTESSAGEPTKYTVMLTVTDNGSPAKSSTDSIIISVNNTPPEVNITSPVKNSTYTVGGDITYPLSAAVNDEEHDPGQLKYAWQTILRHNNHQHAGAIDTTRNSTATISTPGCNGENYYWFTKLTVTDEAGLSAIDSSMIFPFCATLPIVLRKFSVTQRGNENLVKWTTESEMYIEYFEVERSTDGFNFSSINQTAARNTSGPNEYGFTDNNFPAGVNYYRLKITETGLTIRYSDIVKTFSETKSKGLVISPNPATGNFSISYIATDNGPIIIRISDISGRLVTTIHESVNRGQNIIYLQSKPAWKQGVYLVSVQQGSDIQQEKLIKLE